MFAVYTKKRLLLVLLVTLAAVYCMLGTVKTAVRTNAAPRELPIYSVNTPEKQIALTINCAWDDSDIDRLLRILEDRSIKATFFIVGDWCDKYPDAVRKLAQAGHELGSHSDTHPDMARQTREQITAELNASRQKIEDVSGQKIHLFRPPSGSYNNLVVSTARALGWEVIQWSNDVDHIDSNLLRQGHKPHDSNGAKGWTCFEKIGMGGSNYFNLHNYKKMDMMEKIKKGDRNMWKVSFRAKLILIFVVVAIAQGILIGYYSHQYASQIVMSNKKSDMADLVNRIDININEKVRYITRQIENTVSSRMLRDYLDSRNTVYDKSVYFSEYFDFMANSFSAITNVILLDDSRILYDQSGNTAGLLETDRLDSIYQAAMQKQGQAVWLGMVGELSGKRDEIGKQVISVASAIVNPKTQKADGVLLIELDPGSFSSMLLNNYNTYQNQYTFIIDKKWDVICSNKLIDTRWVDLIAAEFDRGNRRFEMDWQGKDYYVCGQYNGVTGWETFSVIAKDNIFTQTKELLQLIKAFVVLCTFGVSMIIMAISYTMTKPLQQLSEAMQRMQSGDFSQQINTERRDEIGRLIHSFNYMAKKINTLINEVYQEKIAQKNAEIKALQSQINPHFLYNTLDSINWMAIDRGAYDVSDIIIALGDLMKYSVDQHNSMVRLEQEMRYVLSYLRIQKNRLEEKLRYEIEIPVALMTCLVPKLMLQPIVENAITHGIEPMKQGGLIRIEGRESNGIIYLEVSDNGKGMDRETLNRIMHHIDHDDEGFTNIGVKNVHKRIQLHYGDEYGLDIESAPGKGTKIVIRIPHREGGSGNENHDRR